MDSGDLCRVASDGGSSLGSIPPSPYADPQPPDENPPRPSLKRAKKRKQHENIKKRKTPRGHQLYHGSTGDAEVIEVLKHGLVFVDEEEGERAAANWDARVKGPAVEAYGDVIDRKKEEKRKFVDEQQQAGNVDSDGDLVDDEHVVERVDENMFFGQDFLHEHLSADGGDAACFGGSFGAGKTETLDACQIPAGIMGGNCDSAGAEVVESVPDLDLSRMLSPDMLGCLLDVVDEADSPASGLASVQTVLWGSECGEFEETGILRKQVQALEAASITPADGTAITGSLLADPFFHNNYLDSCIGSAEERQKTHKRRRDAYRNAKNRSRGSDEMLNDDENTSIGGIGFDAAVEVEQTLICELLSGTAHPFQDVKLEEGDGGEREREDTKRFMKSLMERGTEMDFNPERGRAWDTTTKASTNETVTTRESGTAVHGGAGPTTEERESPSSARAARAERRRLLRDGGEEMGSGPEPGSGTRHKK
eukprot:g6209.t1